MLGRGHMRSCQLLVSHPGALKLSLSPTDPQHRYDMEFSGPHYPLTSFVRNVSLAAKP